MQPFFLVEFSNFSMAYLHASAVGARSVVKSSFLVKSNSRTDTQSSFQSLFHDSKTDKETERETERDEENICAAVALD